jgi:hypothetical protein
MDQDVRKVIIGHMNLGIAEREVVRNYIEQYERKSYPDKQDLKKSFK